MNAAVIVHYHLYKSSFLSVTTGMTPVHGESMGEISEFVVVRRRRNVSHLNDAKDIHKINKLDRHNENCQFERSISSEITFLKFKMAADRHI